MFGKVDVSDPAVFHIVEPFFVIAIVGAMKVEDVLADEDDLPMLNFPAIRSVRFNVMMSLLMASFHSPHH